MKFHRSLIVRLTVYYLVTAGLIFGVSATILGWILSSGFRTTEMRLMKEKIELFVADQSREPDDFKELFGQLAPSPLPGQTQPYWVRILDSKGRTLAETSGMDTLAPPSLFVNPPSHQHLSNGHSYRLQSAWSEVQDPNKKRELQVAMDISSDRLLLAEYRKSLALVVVLAVALLGLLTIVLTRKGLSPLKEISTRIGSLGPHKLHERLEIGEWPVELTQFAEGFNGLLERLDESFKRLSQFSADLAHELRTPIHNLRLQADIVLAKPRKAAEYLEALESAQEEYARLTTMTEGLLFLARAENGRQELHKTKIEVRSLLEKIKAQFEPLAKKQKVLIQTEGRATLTADSALLSHALSNLAANALEHSSPGGQIVLAVERIGGTAVQVSVADTGRGISPDDLPKVFDRFYRADASRRSNGGSGLGLAMVKTVMDLHDGKVKIRSEPNEGTHVTLIFQG